METAEPAKEPIIIEENEADRTQVQNSEILQYFSLSIFTLHPFLQPNSPSSDPEEDESNLNVELPAPPSPLGKLHLAVTVFLLNAITQYLLLQK